MFAPHIIAHACVTPARAKFAADSLGALSSFCEIHTTPAKPGDFGPILKWTVPLPVRKHHELVLVLDDDHRYDPESIRRAASALECAHVRGRQSMIQCYGRTLNIHHLPMDKGGPYIVHTLVWDVVPTDMIEAFAGVLVPVAVFERLSVALRELLPTLGDEERLADDYIVSRTAARLGITRWVAPVAPPKRLEAAALDPVSQRGDGLAARYKRLILRDRQHGDAWWPLRSPAW